MISDILVVDDDVQVSQVAAKILRAAGYRVDVAHSPAEAIEATKPGLAVAIVDLYFGNSLEGIELADRIRAATDADILFATGQPDIETAIDALRHGAYDYLIKPFRPDELLLAVKRCMDKRQLAADLAKEKDLRKRLAEEVARRERLEMQVRQAQKMDAIGRMASMIAHDFNNYLTAIMGSTQMLLNMELDRCARAEAEELRKASDEAAALVRQILVFVRHERPRAALLSPSALIGDMKMLLARLVRSSVQLSLDLGASVPGILIDESQFRQIVMNLCSNARDAMAGEGALTIRTKVVDLEPGRPCLYPTDKAGRYVALEVSDTGCGMEEDVMDHLFEPFFTTKPQGRGTGLGLSTVYEIVRQNHGCIEVASQSGRGTTFSVYFPVSMEPVTPHRGEGAYA